MKRISRYVGGILLLLMSSPALLYALGQNGTIVTVAGNGSSGFSGDGGPATSAQLMGPVDLAIDASGNFYIADANNSRIRKVTVPGGVITTIAGTGAFNFGGDNGPATAAQLNFPAGVALDDQNNLYIADKGNHRIRKIIAATGVMTTVAGTGTFGSSGDNGPATAAQLRLPEGVALDSAGNLYIADGNNHRIRKVISPTGIITTIAGTGAPGFSGDNGPATSAQLNMPVSVTLDNAGNIYVGDQFNHRIRKIISPTGIITTVAGDGSNSFGGDNGPATAAQLNFPEGVIPDGLGNLYIADQSNNRIRKVAAATGIITTVAGDGTFGSGGDGGPATAAQLSLPRGVAFDGLGKLYIAEFFNSNIRRVSDPIVARFPVVFKNQ